MSDKPKITINPKGPLKPVSERINKQKDTAKELGLDDPYARRKKRFDDLHKQTEK